MVAVSVPPKVERIGVAERSGGAECTHPPLSAQWMNLALALLERYYRADEPGAYESENPFWVEIWGLGTGTLFVPRRSPSPWPARILNLLASV